MGITASSIAPGPIATVLIAINAQAASIVTHSGGAQMDWLGSWFGFGGTTTEQDPEDDYDSE